jgi:hypothetical protein
MFTKDLFTRLLVGAAALGALAAFDTLPATASSKGAQVAKGRTSQGRAFGVKLRGDSMKLLAFTAELDCRDGSELLLEEGGFLWTDLSRNGSFSDYQYGKTDKVWFKGRVGARAVRGRVRLSDRWGRIPCKSRWIRFTAKMRH